MVDDDQPVTFHSAGKLLEACSNSLENLSVLTETAKKGVQLQRAAVKQSTAQY